jgi:hypothetical protein
VRQYVPDQHNLILEEDLENQAILIPADIDDGEMADQIGTGEIPPQCGEVAPFRPLGDAQPPLQRFLRVGMLLPEFAQRLPRDDMYVPVSPLLVMDSPLSA